MARGHTYRSDSRDSRRPRAEPHPSTHDEIGHGQNTYRLPVREQRHVWGPRDDLTDTGDRNWVQFRNSNIQPRERNPGADTSRRSRSPEGLHRGNVFDGSRTVSQHSPQPRYPNEREDNEVPTRPPREARRVRFLDREGESVNQGNHARGLPRGPAAIRTKAPLPDQNHVYQLGKSIGSAYENLQPARTEDVREWCRTFEHELLEELDRDVIVADRDAPLPPRFGNSSQFPKTKRIFDPPIYGCTLDRQTGHCVGALSKNREQGCFDGPLCPLRHDFWSVEEIRAILSHPDNQKQLSRLVRFFRNAWSVYKIRYLQDPSLIRQQEPNPQPRPAARRAAVPVDDIRRPMSAAQVRDDAKDAGFQIFQDGMTPVRNATRAATAETNALQEVHDTRSNIPSPPNNPPVVMPSEHLRKHENGIHSEFEPEKADDTAHDDHSFDAPQPDEILDLAKLELARRHEPIDLKESEHSQGPEEVDALFGPSGPESIFEDNAADSESASDRSVVELADLENLPTCAFMPMQEVKEKIAEFLSHLDKNRLERASLYGDEGDS